MAILIICCATVAFCFIVGGYLAGRNSS